MKNAEESNRDNVMPQNLTAVPEEKRVADLGKGLRVTRARSQLDRDVQSALKMEAAFPSKHLCLPNYACRRYENCIQNFAFKPEG